MTRLITAFAAIFLFVGGASAATQTMRLDYYHTGDATSEVFTVDRIVIEPLPWPGDPQQSRDTSNLGKYFFEVPKSEIEAGALLTRVRVNLRRMGNHG